MYPLKPITKDSVPIEFGTFDIESRNWIYFVVAGFYTGKEYFEFRTMRAYINFLRNPKDQTIPETIFAHFGGKFDFMFILREISKHSDISISDFIPRGSGILSFSIHFKKGLKYTFRDSSALLGFSLDTLSKTFDVEIKKGEWDHTKTKKYTKELGEYLKSDCLSLYQVIRKFESIPIIQKSGLAYTMASQSMRVFRKLFLKYEVSPHGKNEEKLCRASYLGGRTEIFRPLCSEKIYCYDVNSLYPYVMRENIFPISSGIRTRRFVKQKLGIYNCEVEAPLDLNIPVLGVIIEKKYIFPVGKFKGAFTSAEITYAETFGYKIKILNGFYFSDSQPLFKEYIDTMYSLRLSTKPNTAENLIYKLLMNAHYGRYGLNPEKENLEFGYAIGSTPIQELDTGQKVPIKIKQKNGKYRVKVCKRVIEICKVPVELNSFHKSGIASFVTSYARIHMHRLMNELGNTLYYTDTDSLWTTSKLTESKDLGGLKLESEHSGGACFILPKTYIAVNSTVKKIAMKGFPSKKIKDFTLQDFQLYLEGEARIKTSIEPRFATFKQAIKKEKYLTMTEPSTKQLNARYTKRIIYKSKGEYFTRPLTVGV